MGDLYFNTARHGLLKAYVGAWKLGIACAPYRPMPQVVGHTTPSFNLNYYYSFYFNTAIRGLLFLTFVDACMRILLAYVIDGGLHYAVVHHINIL